MQRILIAATVLLAAGFLGLQNAVADAVADFYKGSVRLSPWYRGRLANDIDPATFPKNLHKHEDGQAVEARQV